MPGGLIWQRVLKNVEETGVFPNQHKTVLHKTSLEIAEAVDYRCSDRNDTAGYE